MSLHLVVVVFSSITTPFLCVKKTTQTVLVSKQLKEKCRILTEEQFLKYFVDDAWETKSETNDVDSVFVFFAYLDRTTVSTCRRRQRLDGVLDGGEEEV